MSSVVPSSPTAFSSEGGMDLDYDASATASTTVPSSPILDGKRVLKDDFTLKSETKSPDASKLSPSPVEPSPDTLQGRLDRLNVLLEKSSMYVAAVGERMNRARVADQDEDARSPTKSGMKKGIKSGAGVMSSQVGQKRGRAEVEEDDADDSTKRAKKEPEALNLEQPEGIVNVTMKPYQLLGVEWLISLFINGVNGILADEMGLGQTLQTIAFLTRVPETRPALIVCPLSVLHNWVAEFAKFAPSVRVCMYHGNPEERAEIRRNLKLHEDDVAFKTEPGNSAEHVSRKRERPKRSANKPRKNTSTQQTKISGFFTASSAKSHPSLTKDSAHSTRRRSARLDTSMKTSQTQRVEDQEEAEVSDEETVRMAMDEKSINVPTRTESDKMTSSSIQADRDGNGRVESEEGSSKRSNNLVVITTYEMVIKDSKHLSKHQWNFIVVDEGHRLKNMDCRLIREIKKYDSTNRLILTGTPLHNNLAELWSLLNFILPDIFADLDSFQEWFNLPDMQSSLPSEHSSQVISKLHTILKPFLLRRLKADVEHSLPPKKEYVLYAPLSQRQRELYDAIVNGVLRNYLIQGKQSQSGLGEVTLTGKRKSRKRVEQGKYDVDGDDDEWFERLDKENLQVGGHSEELELGRKYLYRNTVKQVNSMKLQNTIMQLRKVCSHPFLFDWPIDRHTGDFVVNDELANASGKMMILDRLLSELFVRKHKVLLFSQFTTMLDIIEEWATSFKSWNICRIDGTTKPDERRREMERFQSGEDHPDAPFLFLLSTRAGGLGITLTAADTVIFYDQDWNPQMDLQAQDRAHRIGQTKPVLIFRLVSAHTIETTIMKRANEKRQLEALIIAKGKFRMPGSSSKPKNESMAEIAANLLRLEGEKIEVVSKSQAGETKLISDADLNKLLDRSPGIFIDRGQGWTSGQKAGEKAESGDVAFEVFAAPTDQCNDSLAAMLAEDD